MEDFTPDPDPIDDPIDKDPQPIKIDPLPAGQHEQSGVADTSGNAYHQSTGNPLENLETDAQVADQQTEDDTRALVAAGSIIHAMTGRDISEYESERPATKNEAFDEGTLPEHLCKIYEFYGVAYHVNVNGTVADLVSELVHGHKILVAVDLDELSTNSFLRKLFDGIEDKGVERADHVIWLTGVTINSSGDTTITVNDSGISDGIGKSYSLSELRDAWEDSGFHYVATDEVPPNFQDEAPDFDPETGVFPEVAAYFEMYGLQVADVDTYEYESLDARSGPLEIDELRAELERDPLFRDAKLKGNPKLILEALEYFIENIRHIDLAKFMEDIQSIPSIAYSKLIRLIIKLWYKLNPQEDSQDLGSDWSDAALVSVDQFVDPVGNLLEAIGINTHTVKNATLDGLMTELKQGQRVVVLRDSWEPSEDVVESTKAVLQLTNVDLSDPDNPLIASSGTDPNDIKQVYALSELKEMWIGSQFHYIAMEIDETPLTT